MSSPPAIEVTDFRGTVEQATDFVNRCWDMQFPDTSTCPQWDREYFAWQLFAQPDNILLGAYDGDELIGFLFSEPLDFVMNDVPMRGLFSSFLTADPTRKGQGIAKRLAGELARRVETQGYAFDTGFGMPVKGSLGPSFWLGSQKGTRARGVRPWVRPLNAAVLADALGPAHERWSARAASVLGLDRVPKRSDDRVRPWRADDLEACLALLRRAEADSDFRYEWSAERLAFQLDHEGTPKTWVYDDGAVRGFANFHRLRFRGVKPFIAGQIDHLLAENADPRIEGALMDRTLQALAETGHDLAVCPSSASTSVRTRLRAGFLPMSARFDFLFVFVSPELDVTRIRNPKIHLR